MSLTEAKKQLIDLYSSIKIRKTSDIDNLTDDMIEKEKTSLDKLSILDIINYITTSIEILGEIKASEKYEEKLANDEEKESINNIENPEDENGLKLYEGMLIKAEGDIRNHIRVSG